MSDEAKAAHLQARMRRARRNQIMSYVVGFVGMILVDFLVIRYWDLPTPLDFILGLVVLMIGIQLGTYYGNQKKKLMEQLKTQHP